MYVHASCTRPCLHGSTWPPGTSPSYCPAAICNLSVGWAMCMQEAESTHCHPSPCWGAAQAPEPEGLGSGAGEFGLWSRRVWAVELEGLSCCPCCRPWLPQTRVETGGSLISGAMPAVLSEPQSAAVAILQQVATRANLLFSTEVTFLTGCF